MFQALVKKAVLWCMAVYYGIQITYEILREVIRSGIFKAFQVKPLSRPACLDDPTLGTHSYLHLEVSMLLLSNFMSLTIRNTMDSLCCLFYPFNT